jgi:hypothetical protein
MLHNPTAPAASCSRKNSADVVCEPEGMVWRGVLLTIRTTFTANTDAKLNLPRKPSHYSLIGRLVVLLPPSLTSVVNSVRLKSSRGDTELDNGRYGGIGNGGRLHFRFGKSGSSYPDGTIVEVLFTDGSKLRVPIGETSARVESK